jgi:hypothetical protein
MARSLEKRLAELRAEVELGTINARQAIEGILTTIAEFDRRVDEILENQWAALLERHDPGEHRVLH